MKRSQKRSSGRPDNSTRRVVKNKVVLGDARLNMGVKPENRGAVPRVGPSNLKSENYLLQQIPDKYRRKRVGRTDGTKMAQEIGAKKPRAAQVYGGKKKALEASYRLDRTTKERIPGTEYKPKAKKRQPTSARDRLKMSLEEKPRKPGFV